MLSRSANSQSGLDYRGPLLERQEGQNAPQEQGTISSRNERCRLYCLVKQGLAIWSLSVLGKVGKRP